MEIGKLPFLQYHFHQTLAMYTQPENLRTLLLALNLMLHINALDNFEEFTKVYTTVQKSFWKKFQRASRNAQLKHLFQDFETVTKKVSLKFAPNEGLSIEDEEVRGILGFKVIKEAMILFIVVASRKLRKTPRTDILEIFQLISLADHS